MASRLLLITIADRERVRNYHVQIHQAVFFTLGAITMSLPLATDFVWLIVVVTIQGMCDGAYFCLIGPIAIKTVGVLDSSQAVGFYIGLCGLSMTVGSSMAGNNMFLNWSAKRVTRITMQTYSEFLFVCSFKRLTLTVCLSVSSLSPPPTPHPSLPEH